MKFRKLTSILSTCFALLTTTYIHALSDNPYTYWDCNDYECSCFLHHAQPCNDPWGFFGGLDYLHWTTYVNDTDFAVDGLNTVGVGNHPGGKYHKFHPLWDNGVRAMAGFRWGYDGWDTRIIYTYFHNHTKSNATPTTGETNITPQFLMATMFTPASGLIRAATATGKFSINYDTLDLVFTRPFYASYSHILRPYFGVRGAWIRQHIKVRYDGADFANAVGRFGFTKWQGVFEGAGVLAGLEYKMIICNDLSLFANLGVSVLGGHHRDKLLIQQLVPNPAFVDSDTNTNPEFLVVNGYVDVESTELSLLPGLQGAAGVNWGFDYCGYCFEFSFAYELTEWFCAPSVRRFQDNVDQAVSTSSSNGALLLHGITFSGDIYF